MFSHCAHCGQPITPETPWLYTQGAYPVGTPEEAKRRIHRHCFRQLLRDTIQRLSRVPEHMRGEEAPIES